MDFTPSNGHEIYLLFEIQRIDSMVVCCCRVPVSKQNHGLLLWWLHIVPVARLEAFRALKLSRLEVFRALEVSRLVSFRALKLIARIGGFQGLKNIGCLYLIF